MVKMRVHLLAKELGMETKELVAQLDKMGMRGRKAQSSLADEEVGRIRTALAAQEKPQVHVGEERVVSPIGLAPLASSPQPASHTPASCCRPKASLRPAA